MNPVKIRKAIASLPKNEPTKCEGQIRQLHKNIQAVKDASEKLRENVE
jgi:hypothetical protein